MSQSTLSSSFLSFRNLCALTLLVAAAAPFANAQNDAQKAICSKHDLSLQRCGMLADEFLTNHQLQTLGLSTTLDDPSFSPRAFAAEIGPSAILATMKSGLSADAKQAAEAALQTMATSAAVTQVGGAATANGSTNLVTKPTTTDLISLAAESGAFTDTVNGTTTTLQANALGLVKYFGNRPIFQRWESKYADATQPLNFSVTLNVAQSSASTAPTTGSANGITPSTITSVLLPSNNASFSGFGVTYNVYRRYSPQDKTFLAAWSKAVIANKAAISAATTTLKADIDLLLTPAIQTAVEKNVSTPLQTWHTAGADAEKKADFDTFVAAYATYDKVFCDVVMSEPDAPKNAVSLVQALQSFDDAVDAVVNQARGTPLATIGYSYSTPVSQPATHNATAAVSYLFKGKPNAATGKGSFMSGAQFTGNFTASIYESLPAGAAYGRFRDVQLSSEFDKPFGGTVAAPRGTVSIAGYGQYQYDPTVLNITAGNLAPGTNIALPSNAQVLLGTAGWLGVVQGKVVFNLSKGLTIPVAIKWSNKTDLLAGSDTRGQIGLSYDLSALSSLLGSH